MPGTIDYSLMRIQPDPDTSEWWAACKEHRFLVRRCANCGYKFFPPFPACYHCESMALGWHETSGRGILYSYIVVTQPVLSAFANAVPYVVGLIELPDCQNPDGNPVRTMGVLLNSEEEVAISLPVEVVYEETPDPEIVVPHWRISGAAPNPWRLP